MIIKRLLEHTIIIQQGSVTISVNPPLLKTGSKGAAPKSDIVLFSKVEPGQDTSEISGFIIKGPGQYEHGGISVTGSGSMSKNSEFFNTVYRLELAGVTLLFLGFVTDPEDVSAEVRNAINEADIVCVPLGTGLAPSRAYTLAKSFSPCIIIPTGAIDDKIVGKAFLGEAGAEENLKPEEKLVVQPKDLVGKENQIVVLV